jgi:hypothetical protein
LSCGAPETGWKSWIFTGRGFSLANVDDLWYDAY